MPINLRSLDAIMQVAAQIKVNILARNNAIKQLHDQLFELKIRSNMLQNSSSSKIETLEAQFEFLLNKNSIDRERYATLFWVLGLSEEIELNSIDV